MNRREVLAGAIATALVPTAKDDTEYLRKCFRKGYVPPGDYEVALNDHESLFTLRDGSYTVIAEGVTIWIR